MGLYSDYGVEYTVILKNGEKIIVVPVLDTYERLVNSQYFLKRKAYYEKYGSTCVKTWHTPVGNDEIDFQLTPEEKRKLDSILTIHDEKVLNHGWYDVCYVGSTL